MDLFYTMFVIGRENEFFQNQLGTLDDELWDRTRGAIAGVLSSRWGRHWWYTVGNYLVISDFGLVVDKALEIPVFAIDEYYESLKLN